MCTVYVDEGGEKEDRDATTADAAFYELYSSLCTYILCTELSRVLRLRL